MNKPRALTTCGVCFTFSGAVCLHVCLTSYLERSYLARETVTCKISLHGTIIRKNNELLLQRISTWLWRPTIRRLLPASLTLVEWFTIFGRTTTTSWSTFPHPKEILAQCSSCIKCMEGPIKNGKWLQPKRVTLIMQFFFNLLNLNLVGILSIVHFCWFLEDHRLYRPILIPEWRSGPLFIKRTDNSPEDLVKSWSREIRV